MHTQGGNNNPFNQDNDTTWLDWSRLQQHPDIFRFFKLAIALVRRTPRSAGAVSGAKMCGGMESGQRRISPITREAWRSSCAAPQKATATST
jgi:pullulanase/glycogen debranching enzyme